MAKVLVTGATGFIAGHVIHQLIEAGHEVTGTARSASKGAALSQTLSAYAGRPVSIPIREADLSSDKGWAEAAEGMDYVHHIASPIPVTVPKNADELIIPARDGALRALKAARAAGVKRVVMTSSMAACAYGWGEARPNPITEEHWSQDKGAPDMTPYIRSKLVAERAAWDYVKGEGQGLELTTINPALVLGPVMSGDFSASVEILTQLMSGKLPGTPKVGFVVVDVRDVAAAHVAAMTSPAAAGERFLLGDRFMWFSEVAATLAREFPAYASKLPSRDIPAWMVHLTALINPPAKQLIPELNRERHISSEKARRVLGWTPRSSEEAVIAGAQSLVAFGVV
ncbi:MAG: aldehyde reductase [Hyphomonas sp.]|uniref:NAD-dependent epimerase/dehydratase family protein n=1 Tax=Hyphomonas sp. TaxID=87 RepID=UPI001DDA7E3E|nr:NAD-dependent epimerase/dehydratase family protein [Hyphomonas sp.]MBA4228080.1 aldehyde reductase [Hyphomonas sp.]